jgi:dipeptidyl aminopeptidase/acylaminoacyl peptidase
MNRYFSVLCVLLLSSLVATGQENLVYQQPPREILDLVNVPLAPSVLMDESRNWMVLLYRDPFKSISELSQPEMRLAGLRINPVTHIGSRVTYYKSIGLKDLGSKNPDVAAVSGLPENALLSNFTWSPHQERLAFTNTTGEGVELWVLDLASAQAERVTEAMINATLGDVINWFPGGDAMLVKMISPDSQPLIDPEKAIPAGPTVSVAEGKKAQNRTFQDLLQNQNDEHNFEQLALSELVRVSLDGSSSVWAESAMYQGVSFSPDGSFVMVTTLRKPFSYLVPYYRFPSTTVIYASDGTVVETVSEVPLTEDLPQGFMAVREGRRNLSWRDDQPAALVFVEALDKGDPQIDVPERDAVYQLNPPFSGEPEQLLLLKDRYSGIFWGNEEVAVAYEYWWNTRTIRASLFSPSDPSVPPRVIEERNYQDAYSDPGQLVTRRNEMGRPVLAIRDRSLFLIGDGYSEEGQFPFLDELNLNTLEKKRRYRSTYTDRLETLRDYDVDNNQLLVRIESPTEYPNFYFRSLKRNRLEQLTAFENPFKSIQEVHKEVITYRRGDGLELSGTLYLPVGYDMEQKEKAPMILWAYPREYKDKASAGQTTSNPNEFTYPSWSTAILWVTRGYVVLDDASFPIVGEGDEEPNDSFRSQLVANAKAAIDAVDDLGYIDRDRVAVGGHSYGAFMVANLLSHSDLFAAGIARSGAYNRTLTPFGFQSEERYYWEAPEVYYNMSPFMHADKMKTPLLLIHGEADNNSGTFPLQSRRYFNALKGLGATARLVMLPLESHGYRARESILHVLWEQDRWLETYVKNKEGQ